MNETPRRITVWCDAAAHARALPVAQCEFYADEDVWKLDHTVSLGGGKQDDGVRDFYDDASARRAEFSHVDPDRHHVIVVCQQCGDRVEVTATAFQRSCRRLAAAEHARTTVTGLRLVVRLTQ